MIKKIKDWIKKKKREKYLKDLFDIDKQIYKAQTMEQLKMILNAKEKTL